MIEPDGPLSLSRQSKGESAILTTRSRTAKNANSSSVWRLSHWIADRCGSAKSRATQTTILASSPAR